MDCSIKLEGQQYLENNDWVFGSKIVEKDEVSNIEQMWKGKKWLLTDSAREVFALKQLEKVYKIINKEGHLIVLNTTHMFECRFSSIAIPLLDFLSGSPTAIRIPLLPTGRSRPPQFFVLCQIIVGLYVLSPL